MAEAPSVASLHAVANWNYNRACQVLRWENHEKNHDRSAALLKEAGRYFRNGDFCKRQAFLLEHRGKKKVKH